jgi:DNA-binding NtrC family response regulator
MMQQGSPTTAVLGGSGPDDAGRHGPRGLLRLHPWSDELAPAVIEVAGPVSVGRDDDCIARLADDSVSRRHAELRPAGLFVEVADGGSRNGTFVREERVQGPVFAQPGDLVRFGRTVYLVVLDVEPCRDWWSGGLKGPVVGGAAMGTVRQLVAQFGSAADPVLITGETGTGKEVVAAAIHAASGRTGPLVAVNCAAVPHSLFESQFFGHRRGSFTGADRDELGFFRAAESGTILLDEVGEMDQASQAKLLRVLETRQVVPLGFTRPEPVQVRVLSATNRDLSSAVDAGSFRSDLYSRLRVLGISLPPLRERIEDVALLARVFLREREVTLAYDAVTALASYRWPGNVREILGPRAETRTAVAPDDRVTDVLAAMRQHGGNVARAAKALGLHRAQIYTALRAAKRTPADFRKPDDER